MKNLSIFGRSLNNPIVNTISYAEFIRAFGQYVVWIIMSIYLYEVRGLTYVDVGIVALAGGLLSFPASLAWGSLVDRIGRRLVGLMVPTANIIIFSGMFFDIFLGGPTWILILFYVITNPVSSAQYINDGALISDTTEESDRVEAFSRTRVAGNIGIGLGLVIGGIIATFNYSAVFVAPAVGSLIEFILYFYRIRDTRNQSTIEQSVSTSHRIFIPRNDLFFIAAAILTASAYFVSGMFESPITPLFLSSKYGFATYYITALFAINTVVVILFQNSINVVTGKWKDSLRISSGLALYAVGYLIIGLTPFFPVVAMAIIVLTLGENLQVPATMAFITRLAPQNRRGGYLGFASAIGSLVYPFRPLVGTIILAALIFSPVELWGTFSLMCAAISVIFLLFSISHRAGKGQEVSTHANIK
ncbi:MAG: MFS transporter [Candidatus Thermoplasmatota archaeon]|jgi:MFS family permease|nr:MFS transporter [Candidatus Thermoplasmatota archaeon]